MGAIKRGTFALRSRLRFAPGNDHAMSIVYFLFLRNPKIVTPLRLRNDTVWRAGVRAGVNHWD